MTAPAPAEPWVPPSGRHHASTDPELRGDLTVADSVVGKIAAQAASEVEHVGGAARRVLGVPLGSDDSDGAPRVDATVSGDVAVLDVHLSLAYPVPVRSTAERVRARLTERVGTLTGLDVARVDVTVTALTAAPTANRRLR